MAQATPTLHDPNPAPEPGTDSSAGGRRLRFALATVAFAAVAFWFGPAIVGRTALRHHFVHAVVPDYPADAAVGGASLGWFSPVVLHEVTLFDLNGVELLTAGELTTSRSLVSLLFTPGDDLGTITLKKPRLTVLLQADGSNLEDVLGPVLEAEGSSAGLTTVVEDGRIEWRTVGDSAQGGTLQDVAGMVRIPAESSWPDRVEITSKLSDGERSGNLSIQFDPAQHQSPNGTREAVLKGEHLPLDSLQPWLQRMGIATQAAGVVSVDVLVTERSGDQPNWSFDGSIDGNRLRLALGPAAGSPLLFEHVSLNAVGMFDHGDVTIEASELRSNLATATFSGQFGLERLANARSWDDRLRWAIDQTLNLSATLDLPRLTAQWPAVHEVRQAVDSGRIELEVRTADRGNDRLAICRLNATDVVAGPAGGRMVWRDPFAMEFRVRKSSAGFSVDHFELTSEFLTLTGVGTAADAELTLEADFDRLRHQIEQFVKLPVAALAGRLTGRVRIRQHDESGRFEFTSGRLTFASHEDELTATLTEPVRFDAVSNWPLKVGLKGDVRRWLSRLRPLMGIEPGGLWDASGTIEATAAVQYDESAVSVHDLVADARQVRIRLGDRSIEEDRVRLTGLGTWSDGAVAVTKANLTCASAAVEAREVVFPLEGESPLVGQLAFRAGIGRIARYVLSDRPAVWLSGVAAGTIDIRPSDAATEIAARIDLERPQLSRPVINAAGQMTWQAVWADEKANLSLAAQFDPLRDRLSIESCGFTATGLSAQATGGIERPAAVANLDLSGTLSCDVNRLRSRLASVLPEGFQITGRSVKPFYVRGPLWTNGPAGSGRTAGAALGWDSIQLWGLAIGAGELRGTLRNQTLSIEPFDLPVGSGRVRGSAGIALAENATLTVSQGRLVEKVVLTPELCRQWLRYAAPILADTTRVEGSASVDVQECRVPLESPQAVQASGTLVLHRANAAPGPFAKSVLEVVRQIQSIAGNSPTSGSDLQLVAPAQNVSVQARNGRIFHDRFVVHLGSEDGPAITTTGSVGFDQTLDLVAEIPLERGWFKEERVAAALGGQTLRIPIRGTLSRPTPDPRVLQEFARRAAAGAIGGFLDRQINKQLEEPLRRFFE